MVVVPEEREEYAMVHHQALQLPMDIGLPDFERRRHQRLLADLFFIFSNAEFTLVWPRHRRNTD
jgi:hypothetical protein